MTEKEAVYLIEVEKIKPNPYQPRTHFDEGGIKELAESIREYGILEPLLVTRREVFTDLGVEIYYELVAGERRLQAAKMLGLQVVPAIIRKFSEKEKLEIALIENLQRRDLNPIEQAKGFARLAEEFSLTQREIALKMGKSREYIANNVRLLKLPEFIKDAISDGRVSESQARLLLAVNDIKVQEGLFNDIVNEKLSVKQAQNRLRKKLAGQKPERGFMEMEQEFEEALGTKVKIQKSQTGIRVEINVYSEEDLEKVLSAVKHKGISGNESDKEHDFGHMQIVPTKKLEEFDEKEPEQDPLEKFEKMLDAIEEPFENKPIETVEEL